MSHPSHPSHPSHSSHSSHPLDRARRALVTCFGASDAPPVGCFAPGRINLVGDHIDYVGGTVLPMSLDRGTWIVARVARSPGVHVHALDADETRSITAGADAEDFPRGHFARFVAGLISLGEGRIEQSGVELAVTGELRGGGLSSSASFCIAVALALMETGHLPRRRGMTLARLAQDVEHRFLGVACGIMDQAAIVGGAERGALALDCASGRVRPVPLDWGHRTLLAIRSRVDRRLADGAYNQRRAELAEGLARIGHATDAIPDLGPAGLQDIAADDAPLRRVRHVLSEQRLVREAIAAARGGDWNAFGAAMTASHASLRDDYDVSCAELDAIVDAASATAGCAGARLTGAGFGGWAIALVERGAVEAVLEAVGRASGGALREDEWFHARPGGPARRWPEQGGPSGP